MAVLSCEIIYFLVVYGSVIMSHVERSVELFGLKFNCAQAVFASFSDELGIDEKTISRYLSGQMPSKEHSEIKAQHHVI